MTNGNRAIRSRSSSFDLRSNTHDTANRLTATQPHNHPHRAMIQAGRTRLRVCVCACVKERGSMEHGVMTHQLDRLPRGRIRQQRLRSVGSDQLFQFRGLYAALDILTACVRKDVRLRARDSTENRMVSIRCPIREQRCHVVGEVGQLGQGCGGKA